MSDESPFDSVPSGSAIARYFWDETDRTHGCDGINLWRDGREYCYLWVESMVDHDMWIDYLLEIRTKREGEETRDYLFVSKYCDSMEVEWHNKPIKFDDPYDKHIDHLHEGLHWFVNCVVSRVERVNAE